VKIALGLSLGEITALTAAGVFDFATGLRVVAERGRLMQLACEQSSGTMASIIGEERGKVDELCREFGVEMANLNCPGQIVISGEKTRINAAVAAGRDRGMRKVILLNVAGAYHSRLMEPARVAFAAFLAGIPFSRPSLTVFTNTTGRMVAEPDDIRTALVKQVVSPVLWENCMRSAAGAGATAFWELGPGAVLAGLARRTNRDWPVSSFAEWADFAA
jgi:[acyl-carrier-protein] S-malonyltransferase